MNRRDFILSTAAFAGLAGCASAGASKRGRILIGACRPNSDAALMKSIGYDFIEGTVAACFAPGKGGWGRPEDLAKNLETTFKTLKALV